MKNKYALLSILLVVTGALHAQNTTWDTLKQQAKTHLMDLVAIDTSVSNPDEIAAARYIYKHFQNY